MCMDKIVEKGGFKFKSTLMSGEKVEPGTVNRKILGTGWNTEKDTFILEVKINTSSKKKGVRVEPDLEFGSLESAFPTVVTKRLVWRIVLSQFDLLGLASVFLIRLKLVMRDLSGVEGQKLEWDAPINSLTRTRFLDVLKLLTELRNVEFPRSIVPDNIDDETLPDLVVFGDGSQQAFCTLAYARWKLNDGGYSCRLISGKTRVAPIKKISVPRIELLGALASVRLATNIEEALGHNLTFKKRNFFTDSTAVLGMVKGDSVAFQEFVGTRVGEIKSKSDTEEEWFWIPTAENLADLGTRDDVVPADLGPGTVYQEGQTWMREEMTTWPCKKTVGKIPEEELKPVARIVSTVKVSPSLVSLEKYSCLNKVERILSNVFKACYKFKHLVKKEFLIPENKDLLIEVQNFLMYQSQHKIREEFLNGSLASLFPRKLAVSTLGNEREIIVTSGRLGGSLVVGYDKEYIPILDYKSPLSRLIMTRAHRIEHCGADRTLQRSRTDAWIIRGRRLAKVIKAECFKCKLRQKILQEQLIAPLPESRLPPAPVFNSTAVDLFGPISIRDTVKGKVKKSCWGVLFCCTVTSAIHLEVTEDYSCDSFLLALRRFINLRGVPSRFQSDPGTQLMAAAKEYKTWDFSRITEWSDAMKTVWYTTPTDSQHYNGCAEAMIKVTKRQLSEALKNRSLTKGELDTLFSDVMYIVNSRPLMKGAGDDPLSGNPITPLHLLGGRCTLNIPTPRFDGKANLTKRLRFLEELKDDFWRKWFAQVFHHLVPCYKWRTESRNVQVGDIVLVKESNPLRSEYKLARVGEVYPGLDGKVRRVKILYKNLADTGKNLQAAVGDLKKKSFFETERCVQKIVVIVPKDWNEEEITEAVTQGLKVFS